MVCFLELPDEVVMIIFSALPLIDRKRTKLVCTRFRQINAILPAAKKDVTLVCKYSKLSKLITPYSVHTNVRLFPSYKITNHVAFWETYGAGIASVSIEFSENIQLQPLKDVLKYCPNVKYLTLVNAGPDHERDCSCPPVELELANLTSLELRGNICPQQFKSLLCTPVNLKSFKANIKATVGNTREMNAMIECALTLLKRQGALLCELSLTGGIEEDQLIKIGSYCSGQRITKLSLVDGPNVTDTVLCSIKQYLVNLEELELGMTNLWLATEECLVSLLRHSTKLTHIALSGGISCCITKTTAAALGTLPNLSNLTLCCCNITDKGMKVMFGLKEYPKMKYLSLSDIGGITDSGLQAIASNLPNLRTLCLSGDASFKSDSLKTIGASMLGLEQLKIIDCFDLSCEEFPTAINTMKNLVHLEIRKSDNFLGSCFCCYIGAEFLSDFKLNKLRVVAVTHHEKNLNLFKPVFSNCPLLEYIVDPISAYPGSSPRQYQFAVAVTRACDRRVGVQLWEEPMFNVTTLPYEKYEKKRIHTVYTVT